MEFEQGEPVIIRAPSFYRETRAGIFLGPCKDHDDSFRVLILDPDAPIKEVCVNTSIGDTIVRLADSVVT